MSASTPSYAEFRARRVFGSLDGLRCFSIATVVWHHSDAVALIHEHWPAARYGFLGVDLFFVISGFLIVTLLLRERDKKGAISLGNFYVRRSLRILPVYYGVLALVAVLLLGLKRGTPAASSFAHDLPILVFYLSNWLPVHGWLEVTWSLAAEEQFYLVWPPVEKYLKRLAIPILVAVIVCSQLIQLGLIDGWLQSNLGWDANTPPMLRETTFTPICLGVALAHMMHRERGYRFVYRLLGHPWVAPILFVAVIGYANMLPAEIRGLPRLGMHVLLLGLLAACVVREDHGLRPMLTWAPVARVGALSYGIYLFHQMCMTAAQKGLAKVGLDHPVAVLLIAAVLVWLVAEVSFRFYESRFLRLKKRFG